MSDVKRRDSIAGDIVHVYDGIEEADNELPNWWLALFIGAILFSGAYWLAAEKLGLVATPEQELAAFVAEQRERTGVVSDADLEQAATQAAVTAEGKKLFATTCVVCHGDKAEGKIGPNLTDPNWLHGGAPSQIFASIRNGVPAKGMPSWGPVLGEANVASLTAYVLTLRNSAVPGKAPEGETWQAK
jgi:cytochrome c oxidase cbb3-type subunit 3